MRWNQEEFDKNHGALLRSRIGSDADLIRGMSTGDVLDHPDTSLETKFRTVSADIEFRNFFPSRFRTNLLRGFFGNFKPQVVRKFVSGLDRLTPRKLVNFKFKWSALDLPEREKRDGMNALLSSDLTFFDTDVSEEDMQEQCYHLLKTLEYYYPGEIVDSLILSYEIMEGCGDSEHCDPVSLENVRSRIGNNGQALAELEKWFSKYTIERDLDTWKVDAEYWVNSVPEWASESGEELCDTVVRLVHFVTNTSREMALDKKRTKR